jgi:hypothetical protein
VIDYFGNDLFRELDHIFSGKSIEEIPAFADLKMRSSNYSDERAIQDAIEIIGIFKVSE